MWQREYNYRLIRIAQPEKSGHVRDACDLYSLSGDNKQMRAALFDNERFMTHFFLKLSFHL